MTPENNFVIPLLENCAEDSWLTSEALSEFRTVRSERDADEDDVMDTTSAPLATSKCAGTFLHPPLSANTGCPSEDVEEAIGYEFQTRTYLEMSLDRGSQRRANGVFDYLRLAFLGDALIDVLVVQELFRKNPNATAG